ncbi:MAG: Acg family FMN-binding oxidoreductase [Rubricella sp.]
MPSTRRAFLTVIGGGAILAAGAGTWFATSRTPERALAPWAMAAAETDPRRYALAHAILAPNPHNLQPWMIDLSTPGEAAILRDPARALPHTDPFDRQITIGFGCFLEQMTIAAAGIGYGTEIALFPEGEGGPVARVRFVEGAAARDPLFDHVMARRSTKEPFDMSRPVAAGALPALDPAIAGVRYAGTADEARVAALRDLAWEAWVIEYETPRTQRESVDLMRLGRAEIEANPDGIDLGGPFLEGLMLAGMLNRQDLSTPGTQSFQAGYDLYEPMIAATPAFVWLATPGNAREDQIATGRAWLRLNLETTAAGLALHPISQCLQEFPEMAALYARAHGLLGRPGETVQMLGRLGYADPVPITPRWSLDAKLTSA